MTVFYNSSYIVTPFLAWLITGIIKFLVNYLRNGKGAFKLVGYGGFPSNHASIAFSSIGLIYARLNSSPELLICITFSFLVVLDASSLRMQISKQAQLLNSMRNDGEQLRERIGHSKLELLAGALLGFIIGYFDLCFLLISFVL